MKYGVGDEYVYSPWSNELSAQSESYYSSDEGQKVITSFDDFNLPLYRDLERVLFYLF